MSSPSKKPEYLWDCNWCGKKFRYFSGRHKHIVRNHFWKYAAFRWWNEKMYVIGFTSGLLAVLTASPMLTLFAILFFGYEEGDLW
jgi:uncharacterized C2H2 Zn-finger protein